MNSVILLNILVAYGIPQQDATTLVCIAEHESRFNPKAHNKTHNRNGTEDLGLFQINTINFDKCKIKKPEKLFDAHVNIACAYKIYTTQGLEAWATLKFCS